MQILYSSLHNLDLNMDEPMRKAIPSDFESYMQSYIEFATVNDAFREYTVRDKNRTAISCISNLFSDVVRQEDDITDVDTSDSMADSIALKLLDAEKNAQERVNGLTNIQKGSIVQALIKEEHIYTYIIAKVEHAGWFDGETLEKNFGFPSENKRVWKSAVINLEIVADSVMFSSIRCYINTQAKYWTESFLEVDVAKNDTANTLAAMKAIDKVLNPLRETAPIDYYKLRNSATQKLQTEQMINFPDMVGDLLDHYSPDEESVGTAALKAKLLALPEQWKFDTQFHTDPKAIKNLKKVKISVSPTVDVLIREAQNNWEEDFLIHENPDGKQYLMIRCIDEKTLKKFPRDM